jgi:enoyl-CoA hydratase/carnithine racemase
MEVRWGLVPDMAGTVLMRRLARDDVIRELTYTGRVFSGEEALGHGFATRVCADPYEAAHATAREIAGHSPDAIEAAKRIWNAECATAEAALTLESVEQQKLLGSPNQRETLAAHKEKRAPVFRPSR